jgi:hypothetical protein
MRLNSIITFSYTPEGCRTVYSDGATLDSYPHLEMPHYYVISHRTGYGDDVMAYCREHDLFHHLVACFFGTISSSVLWRSAHSGDDGPIPAAYEEVLVMTCQKWVRANERPIIGDVNWDAFKAKALGVLAQVEEEFGLANEHWAVPAP